MAMSCSTVLFYNAVSSWHYKNRLHKPSNKNVKYPTVNCKLFSLAVYQIFPLPAMASVGLKIGSFMWLDVFISLICAEHTINICVSPSLEIATVWYARVQRW